MHGAYGSKHFKESTIIGIGLVGAIIIAQTLNISSYIISFGF